MVYSMDKNWGGCISYGIGEVEGRETEN